MRLAAAGVMVAALLAGTPAESAQSRAETLVYEKLRSRYTELAGRAGITLQPGTALWERSLRATARATVGAMEQGTVTGRVPRSFTMPTFGMEPNILKGELFYALEDYYLEREPLRGEVVLYKVPAQGLSYVRRIIGLPGETIQFIRGEIHVDGKGFPRQRTGIFVDDSRNIQLARFTERLPEGFSYEIVADAEKPRLYNTKAVKLANGRYLVLGDNREQAVEFDAAGVGIVERQNIIDRPEIVWLSRDPARIGHMVQPR